MAKAMTGVVHGNAVVLDAPVPLLDGRRVRVELEAMDEKAAVSDEALRAAWQAWVVGGSQGPIDGDDETDFPDAAR